MLKETPIKKGLHVCGSKLNNSKVSICPVTEISSPSVTTIRLDLVTLSLYFSGHTPVTVMGTNLDIIQTPLIRAKYNNHETLNVNNSSFVCSCWADVMFSASKSAALDKESCVNNNYAWLRISQCAD